MDTNSGQKKQYLVVDFEVAKFGPFENTRFAWTFPASTNSFEEAIKEFKKYNGPDIAVVQYINKQTGETIKGPKYDTTTMDEHPVYNVKKELGNVKQQNPHEPSQHEPRDRFQENSTMTQLNKFKSLVKECLKEVKQESDPRFQLKESLRSVVKEVLNEISNVVNPEPDKEEKEKVSKGYNKAGNERLDKENVKQQKELETLVHGINSDWLVYWDDHLELNVDAKNLLRVRITPKFENNFDIDAMVKLVDRVRVIGVTWEQVKKFVKANFSDLENETIPDKLKNRTVDDESEKDANKGKNAGPEGQTVKVRYQDPKNPSVKDTKKDDKNYNEPATKRDEDMPDQPMKKVTEPGKDPDSKNKKIEKTPQVKPQKFKKDDNADKLKTDLPATKKFRVKKS